MSINNDFLSSDSLYLMAEVTLIACLINKKKQRNYFKDIQ